MRIGTLITSISNFGQKGFYNSQEIGLAKALSEKVDSVEIYKLVPLNQERKTEEVQGYKHIRVHFIPARNSGINGKANTEDLDASLDALIHFADTQFSVPKVYRWCRKKAIRYVPYIGVVESHSTSRIKRIVTNLLFQKNLAVYRKCDCCVKTPSVQERLAVLGINQTVLTPVGLDLDLLRKDYAEYCPDALKKKHGFAQDDKVVLFIGRLIEEKQPVRMIKLMAKLHEQDRHYKLLMVGTGPLKAEIDEKIRAYGISDAVHMVDSIPNSDIWELYRLADAFVNLNQQEIFGMAILEAMYYGCKVVAWTAPGPDFIVENNISGCIREDNESLIDAVVNQPICAEAANARVMEYFTWENAARGMAGVIENTL